MKEGIELILVIVLPVLFYAFLRFLTLGWVLLLAILAIISIALATRHGFVIEASKVAVFVIAGIAISPGLCLTLNLDQRTSLLVIVATVLAGLEAVLLTDVAFEKEQEEEQQEKEQQEKKQ